MRFSPTDQPLQQDDWQTLPNEANSVSLPNPPSDQDLAYCMRRVEVMLSCYRKADAQVPDGYTASIGAVLHEYTRPVVDYVTDPRTGIPNTSEWPPNVFQTRKACEDAAAQMHRKTQLASEPKRVAVRVEPPPLLPGQLTYYEFLMRCERDGVKARPVGAFEPGGYLGPSREASK